MRSVFERKTLLGVSRNREEIEQFSHLQALLVEHREGPTCEC